MITVDNQVIVTSVYDILVELRSQLMIRGIELFRDIKVGPQDLAITCPVHKDGQENSPSCGVSLVDKGDVPAGTVHCFTCGYTATLPEMISLAFGRSNDKGEFGKKWLISNFYSLEVENRKAFIDFDKKETEIQYVSEEELKGYRFYHPYMFKRKLTEEIINKFDVGYDRQTNCVTFPVWDAEGRCLFVARRSIVGKFFNYPRTVDKPLYGLHLLPKDCKSVVICESIFNALTSWIYGRPAIALLGTGSFTQIDMLAKLPYRHYVLALDPDEAGDKGCLRMKERLGNKSLSKLILPPGKDVNDLTYEEFINLEEILF